MPALLFQKSWDVVGDEVSNLCLDVLNGNSDVASLNTTMIALISKEAAPTRSAFIPQRLIHDNILVTFESIYCLKVWGKKGRKKVIFKLDMAKAYDRGYCFGSFSSTRCLRQGDSISPYLFMIVGEGLSALLQHAKALWLDSSSLKVKGEGWRLLEFPNTSVARMLKVRYFENSEFMSTELGSTPSYTWRSILWGHELLQKGMRWRIGDGRFICFW
ncbi:hypothetical protein ACFX1T_040643 [Malus domestica]